MDISSLELRADQLRRSCQPDALCFETTAEVDKLDRIVGQERATRAIEFGIEMRAEGYNVFAMGPSGAGKSSTILHYLQQRADERPVPSDWAYVQNPNDAYRPLALPMPAGRGRSAANGLRDALRTLEAGLKTAFTGSVYEEARSEVTRTFQQLQQQQLRQLETFALQRSFALMQTPTGLTFAPMLDGRALSMEEFSQLDPDKREAYSSHEAELEQALEKTLRSLQDLQEQTEAQISELNGKVASSTIHPLFEGLRDRFADCEHFVAFTQDVEADIIRRVVEARLMVEQQSQDEEAFLPFDDRAPRWSDIYTLNLVVDHAESSGAPVVHEINPSYPNLLGKIEFRAENGVWVPDHHTIRPGALHRANGGYLVIDARTLLSYPMAWEGLKRALRYKEIRIDDPAAQVGAIAAASLAPESIPLDVKVVLIGDAFTYYTLYSQDGAFAKLFKVRADFASDMGWSSENVDAIASFIRLRSEEEDLRAFDIGAVAEIVEYASRVVEHQQRLTTRFAHIADVLREADYWAGKAGANVVGRDMVRRAIDERRFRSNLYEEELQRAVDEGTLLVDTDGRVVGQVNGLEVVALGDYEFGRPSRITASTFLGSSGIINIERESRLSGRIHDKGMLILAGYLGQRYGQDKPLNLNASITFEQSYDYVDGDSASSGELYALLSALSGIPIEQGIAVTGSVNQLGRIQAIGGVNAKVEGFFDLCNARGLNGRQGVIFPRANAQHLMLRADVVAAVAAGEFHLWAASTVDEGFAILSGAPAGERGDDGRFPAGTFNRRVDDRLREMAEALTKFSPKGVAPATAQSELSVPPEEEMMDADATPIESVEED